MYQDVKFFETCNLPTQNENDEETLEHVVEFLKVIADETRLQILDLVKNQPKTATEIQTTLEKHQPVVSQHLKILTQADLLTYEQDGPRKYFQVKNTDIFDLLTTIRALVPPQEEIADYLKTWADGTRFLALQYLLEHGEVTTSELKKVINKHASTLSQQLKILVHADLVEARRDGTQKFYKLQNAQVRNFIEAILAYISEKEGVENEKILIMGLHKSGKTSIMRSLMGVRNLLDFYDIKPTLGVSRIDFTAQRTHYFIWECGGQERYREIHLEQLDSLTRATDKLIYVIDVQDKKEYPLALEYLREIIERLTELSLRLEIVIYLHKFDPGLEFEDGFNDETINDELISKIRDLIPTIFPYTIFKTTIFTVFRQAEVFA